MTSHSVLTDKFGRQHDYLRISLTERCNLRCFYCMPEEGIELRDRSEFMSTEETIALARTFVNLGVKKIRLTGGEPLIKKNISEILNALSEMGVELGITTNGILVDKYIEDFKKTGLKSVNLSLDSLQRDKFNWISRRGYFDRILANMHLLIREGFKVKINVVVMRDVNDNELIDFIELTRDHNIEVRFIEFMPFDGNQWNWEKKVSFREIMDKVHEFYTDEKIFKVEDAINDTTRHFQVKGHKGIFGVISSVTNPFCDTCNRLRLTADGRMKNCLFSGSETDLLSAYRSGKDIVPLIQENVMAKQKAHGGIKSFEDPENLEFFNRNRSMTTIGG